MKPIKISLNLIYYFKDHRQLTRIFINDNMQTIGDLEEHIIRVFNIDKHFYLMCLNQYIPSSEDIRILNDGEVINVIPAEIKKKHTSRRKSQLDEQSADNEQIIQDEPIEIIKTKKKRKSLINEDENNTITEKKRKKGKKTVIVEEVLPEIEVSLPKKTKRKRDTEQNQLINSESSQWDIKMAEDSVMAENSVMAQNSKMADASNKKCSTKAIIHSVEVVKEPEEIIASVSIIDRINLFERLSPQNKSGSVESSDMNNSASATSRRGSLGGKSLKDKLNNHLSVGSTLNLLTNSDSLSNSIDFENIGDALVTKRRRVRTRKRKRLNVTAEPERVEHVTFRPPKSRAAPIQHIKFNHENDSLNEYKTPPEMNNSINNHNGIDNVKNSEDNVNTPTELNGIENDPKYHSTPYVGDDSLINSSHSYNDSEVNTSANDSNRISMKFDAMNYPLLTDTPVKDNLIFFKKLKISEDYTPQVSNYIFAQVRDVSADGNQVTIQILDGQEEFREPKGKFSCIPEAEEEDDDKEEDSLDTTNMAPICIDRASLIEPRIMKYSSKNL